MLCHGYFYVAEKITPSLGVVELCRHFGYALTEGHLVCEKKLFSSIPDDFCVT